MPSELTFLAALLVGFLGSTHCIGMCGGIAGATGVATAGGAPRSFVSRASYLLLYNFGRIFSYVVAGFLAATLGQIGLSIFPAAIAHGIALSISIVFLFGLGSYLAGWWSFLPGLERAGGTLWRVIEPWGRKLLPVKYPYQAFLFGAVWGWLPCGLVYSVLAWSAVTGEPWTGALMMAGFGLGTLPTLLCLGMAGQVLQRLRRNKGVRQAAGISLILFAAVLFGLYKLNTPTHGNHPHHVLPSTLNLSEFTLLHEPSSVEQYRIISKSLSRCCHHPSVFCGPALPDRRTALI